MISQIKSKDDILTVRMIVELLLLAVACAVPVVYKIYAAKEQKLIDKVSKVRLKKKDDSDEEGTPLKLLDEDQ